MPKKLILLAICTIGILLISGCTNNSKPDYDYENNKAEFMNCMNLINLGEPYSWEFETQSCIELNKANCQTLHDWNYIELYEGWTYFINTATGRLREADKVLIYNNTKWDTMTHNHEKINIYVIEEDFYIANNSCIIHEYYNDGHFYRNRIKNNCKDHVFEVCAYDPDVTKEEYL